MRTLGNFLALTILAAGTSATADEKPFALKNGDRVVFYGDSITEQRLYTTFVETYVVTRFPKMDVTFVHSGWGGDRVGGGGGGPIDVRLKRDVLTFKPTVVTIMLGMNDASYRPFDQKIFDTYSKGYEHIVETLKKDAPGVRLTLIQPSPYDDVTRKPNFEGGYNAVLLKYADFVKDLAGKQGAGVADLNTGLVDATKKADAENHDLAMRFNFDRVHPGPAGQLLMAEGLLKAWNAPAIVSSVQLDTEASTSVKAENTKVSELVVGEKISWVQEDQSLPFPLLLNDPATALAVKSSDVVDALDRQVLKVANLKGSEYKLKIDGQEVGKFTKEALAEGVNLATLDTPMARQARKVHDLTLLHNNLHYSRWRQIQVPLEGDSAPEIEKAMKDVDDAEAEIVKLQRQEAQPKPHRMELVP